MKKTFTGNTRLFLCISGAIIVIALIMQIAGAGLNLGIDFTGGSILNYSVGEDYDVNDVEAILNASGYTDNQITKAAPSAASRALQAELAAAAAEATEAAEEATEEVAQAAEETAEAAEETAEAAGEAAEEATEEADNKVSAEADGETKGFVTAKADGAMAGVYDWIKCIIFAISIVVICLTFLFRLVDVEGHSMNDTLVTKDKVFVTSMFYQPHNNDIVVISHGAVYEKPIIKRVIATEGQTLQLDYENDKIIVDGIEISDGMLFRIFQNIIQCILNPFA